MGILNSLLDNIGWIISGLGILGTVFGFSKAVKIANIVKELKEVVITVRDAVRDKELTVLEKQKIIRELNDVIKLVREF